MVPCPAPKGMAPGDYYMGIEELQGAWIGEGADKYWEEAEGGTETWDEEYTDDQGNIRIKTYTRETQRARRCVIKRFESNGRVKNAFDGAYSGPRKWS